ncbi:VOC family protein [Nonomuraea turkmeniaca]|uniref:VOC family protein n=1 Tax=Nonomuraea turkmeniaca TaxID=103838 RepID=A0A5S4F9F4_9ACTN|nr:VOC family protein [Nonomuraea turkmeniaca]TMR12903.1 VOC family protein [Nonomuraea turkmeniaca]
MDITGVRHLKIFVSDLAWSRQWYEKVFRLEHDTSFQDEDGVIRGMSFRVPGTSLQIALRENPGLAEALYDADPFALATTREALDAWDAYLDDLDIPHTPVMETTSGHALGFRDPDGMQIRLYAHDEKVRAARGDVVESGRIDPDELIKKR